MAKRQKTFKGIKIGLILLFIDIFMKFLLEIEPFIEGREKFLHILADFHSYVMENFHLIINNLKNIHESIKLRHTKHDIILKKFHGVTIWILTKFHGNFMVKHQKIYKAIHIDEFCYLFLRIFRKFLKILLEI